MMKLDWLAYRAINYIRRRSGADYKVSWSQCGEDIIVRFLFDTLHIPAPTYLDIGAHHPTYLNNTQLFYTHGSRGVNVEPDPKLFFAFAQARKRDVNLNIGIGEREGFQDFYVMSTRTLNTFSAADAQAFEREGSVRIERVVHLPVRPINAVLEEHCGSGPDFLSLDVEGLDLAILCSMDFGRYRPKVVCVETITFSEKRLGKKISEIEVLMNENGYFAYADTHINTIFVDRRVW